MFQQLMRFVFWQSLKCQWTGMLYWIVCWFVRLVNWMTLNPENELMLQNIIDFQVTLLTSGQLETLQRLYRWKRGPLVFTQRREGEQTPLRADILSANSCAPINSVIILHCIHALADTCLNHMPHLRNPQKIFISQRNPQVITTENHINAEI